MGIIFKIAQPSFDGFELLLLLLNLPEWMSLIPKWMLADIGYYTDITNTEPSPERNIPPLRFLKQQIRQ
jgi:hypothetical protein